ncbi:MAG: hypothetical protein S4CHLAM102_00110 [Chlamydiia bacterium]|nr:hypothetical protein [Chlamydiia bacterium]
MRLFFLLLYLPFGLIAREFDVVLEIDNRKIAHFESHTVLFEHQFLKDMCDKVIYKGAYPHLLTHRDKVHLEIGREIMNDLGGEEITLHLADGMSIDGIYFDPNLFDECAQSALEKWRAFFALEENQPLQHIFGINIEGESLSELFSLPSNVNLDQPPPVRGVYVCPGAGGMYENSPDIPLMYLCRGMHVVVFNYRGVHRSTGTPSPLSTSMDALLMSHFLRDVLNCEFGELVVQGISMGSAPAAFAASLCEGLHLICDRGFSTLDGLIDRVTPLPLKGIAHSIARRHYPYESLRYLPEIQGRIAFIEGESDHLMAGEAMKNFESLAAIRYPEAEETDLPLLCDRHVFNVVGGHVAPSDGGDEMIWIFDERGQELLTEFLFGTKG